MTNSAETLKSILSQVKLLQILAALERAGISPATTDDIHAFAFFSNVLSPLWDLEPLDGAILKDSDGPYYPQLQAELDCLVGRGLASIARLGYRSTSKGGIRLDADFRIEPTLARTFLDVVAQLPDEQNTDSFLTELAFAFVKIKPNRRDDAAMSDAAYSDPAIADGRIVDFAQWNDPEESDVSVRVAREFQKYAPKGMTLNRAEELVMYMRLVKRRAHG